MGFSQEGIFVIYMPSTKKMITTNHVRFDESYFSYLKRLVIASDEYVKDRLS